MLRRASLLRWSLQRSGKRSSSSRQGKVDLVALTHGLAPRQKALLASTGWRVIDVSSVAPMFQPLFSQRQGHHWPRAANGSNVLQRRDGNCTSFKFLAWNMTMYERILLVDSDVCVLEGPYQWMAQRAADEYFVGIPDRRTAYIQQRGFLGLTTHIMCAPPVRTTHTNQTVGHRVSQPDLPVTTKRCRHNVGDTGQPREVLA